MKRGERVIVDIEGLTPRGDGLAVQDGREVLVPRSVPGDRAEVYLRRKRKGRFEGVVDDLIEEGVARVDPPCTHFGLCGGCRWQDLEYEDQLRLKERMVHQSFERRALRVGRWLAIAPSPDRLFYRNKMEFSFGGDRQGRPWLGLHVRERFNRIFDLEACHLQSEVSNGIVDAFRTHATRLDLPAYDLKSHEGLLRFLVVREAKGTGQTMVNLVVREYPHVGVDQLLAGVLDQLGDEVTTCLVTRHSGRAQVAAGEESFLVKGEGRIIERCGGLDFEISPQSFFQTNTRGAGRLYGIVGEFLGSGFDGEVLDLYAGTGGISLHVASRARGVVGVEQVREAVVDARRNAERNGIDNCAFVASTAEEALADLREEGTERFEAIIADPPRAGLHRKVIEGVVSLGAPLVLYVSCNSESLAEDLSALCASGYEVERAQPVDLFPHTPHCEVVVRLSRSPRWTGIGPD